MSLTKRVGLLAGTTALALTSGSLAGTGAEADQNKNLEARLAAAEAKIAQLTAQDNDNWLTEQRSSEIRSLVQDVLADADTRSSLLQQGITAGYDGGAVLGSSDGNWLLRTNILMQQRWIYNNAGDDTSAASTGFTDENLSGFENSRTKFILTGHVVSPDWTFRIDNEVGTANTGRLGTTNAYIGYNYGDGWNIKIGSMKAPVLREELVEAQHQLATERSNLNYAYTAGYVDGLAISNGNDQYRWTLVYSDGGGSAGGSALAGLTAPPTPGIGTDPNGVEYAFTGRFEYLVEGTWGQFEDFTSKRGSENGLMIGAALHFQKGESGTAAVEAEVTVFTVDVSWEGDGANVFAAYIFSDTDFNTAGTNDPETNGLIVQGGYYFEDDWEVFARYEWSDYDFASGTTFDDDLNIITIGVNHYIAGHNAKWTTDISWGNDSVLSGGVNGAPSAITGFRADETDEDGQVVIRTQLSILF